MKAKNTYIIMQDKVFVWIALATGLILSIPLIMMQFSDEWDWNLPDFIIIGALLYGTGSIFVHVARVTPLRSSDPVSVFYCRSGNTWQYWSWKFYFLPYKPTS